MFKSTEEDHVRTDAWREAAIADGWAHEPLYPTHEGENRACKLTREGWVAFVMTRRNEGTPNRSFSQADVTVWGPDGLQVVVPGVYGWDSLQAAFNTCMYCKKSGIPTERVGFAGRTCAACLDEQRARVERPGWRS